MNLDKLKIYLYMISYEISHMICKLKIAYNTVGRPMYFVRPIFVYFK